MNRSFRRVYRCHSVAMLLRSDAETGGRSKFYLFTCRKKPFTQFSFSVYLPPSAMRNLCRCNVEFPLKFKITNKANKRQTHAGVLEFTADEQTVNIPYWMMQHLKLNEGDPVAIECVSLPVATFAKFQPQSVDFLDITDSKTVLECCLRHFSCLTTGDMISIEYNEKVYVLNVLETKPARAVTILECDLNVITKIFESRLSVTIPNDFRWISRSQSGTRSRTESGRRRSR